MSKIEKETIEMMATNMQYIKLGLDNTKGDFAKAQWLYRLIKSYYEDADAQGRADAISERNRLNAGYSKAGH